MRAAAVLLVVVVPAIASAQSMPVRWPRQPLLDRATARVRATEAREELGLTGAGASVCVIDSGIDLRHRDFLDHAGRTRVRALLEVEEGRAWSGAEIDAALLSADPDLPRDRLGHGTAVAAVAAGDDSDGDAAGPLAGVAVAASLVVVDAWREGAAGFADEDIAEGARFCEEMGEPGRTVIVLGLGGHDGTHDGSEPLERALGEIAARGVPIVVAAGNDGDRAVHASGWLAPGEVAVVDLHVPAPEPGARRVGILVESERADAASVAIVTPDGTRSPIVRPGFTHAFDHGGGRVAIDATRPRRIELALSGGAELGGRYALEVHGPARFHAWLVGADVGETLLAPRLGGPFVDPSATITIPGTSPSVITVGATDADGAPAPWSARGPTVRGAPKPDILAPGGPLVTALSADLDPEHPYAIGGGSPSRLAALRVGADRVTVTGTSFAAPLVAGALALALAHDPSRGRAALLRSARRLAAAPWDPHAATGHLDTLAYLGDRPVRNREVVLTRSAVAPGGGVWVFARGEGERLTLTAPDGTRTVLGLDGGLAAAALPPPRGRAGDVIAYRAEVDGAPLPPLVLRLHVDHARDTLGFGAGGGCSVGPGAPPPAIAWLVLLAATARRRARSR